MLQALVVVELVTLLVIASVGPTPLELRRALVTYEAKPTASIGELRKIECQVLGDPSEYSCKYQEREGRVWKKHRVIVAVDGSRWILLDDFK